MKEPNSNPALKRGRGRPTKNGVRSGADFARTAVALEAYQRAREAGAKYDIAVRAAVDAVRRAFPRARFSATAVKNVLSECMSTHEGYISLLVTKQPGHTIVGQGLDLKRTTYELSLGPRPSYPRVNRKDRDRRSGNAPEREG